MASISAAPTDDTKTATVRFDPSYARSIPGLLKTLQIATNLLGFMCSQDPILIKFESAAGYYSFVSMTAFWLTFILLILYLFHITDKMQWIPWLLVEFAYCAIWSVLYFIAAILAATKAPMDGTWGAASFFGFVAMLMYGYDAFVKLKAWRSGRIDQSEEGIPATLRVID